MAHLDVTLMPLQAVERVRDALVTYLSGAKDTAQDEGTLDAGQTTTTVTLPDPGTTQILIQPDDDNYRPQSQDAVWIIVNSLLPGNKTLTEDRSVLELTIRVWTGSAQRPSGSADPSSRQAATRRSLGFLGAVISVLEKDVVGGAGIHAAEVTSARQARPIQESKGMYYQIWDVNLRVSGARRHSRGL